MNRRVVITGLGVISPLGYGWTDFWTALTEGKCGIGPITKFDLTGYDVSLAAEVKGFEPGEFMERKKARHMDLYCQYGVAAAKLAVMDSGIDFESMDTTRVGALMASGVGGISTLEAEQTKLLEKGSNRVSPFFVPMMIANIAAGLVTMDYKLHGMSVTPVSACASSANAIGDAFRSIKHGYLDVAIAGGSEAAITPLSIAGFARMTTLSKSSDPNAASLPFDARRDGFVMGEGGAVLILESLDNALARGATIYAEVAGYGATSDAHHITGPAPDGKWAACAMSLAAKDAGLAPEDIDYINAHGTGTALNDKCETLAIRTAFGDAADSLMVSSTKSATGHMLGAAGALEAIVSALAVRNNIAPPTINLDQPDPECDLDYVPHKARNAEINAALSNSFGFGGHNVSLLFKKYAD